MPFAVSGAVRAAAVLPLLLSGACDVGDDAGIEFAADGKVDLQPTGTRAVPLSPLPYSTGAIETFQVSETDGRLLIQGPIMSVGATPVDVVVDTEVPADPITGKVPPEPVAPQFLVLTHDGQRWSFLQPVRPLTRWSTPNGSTATYGFFPVLERPGKYYGVLDIKRR